MVATDIAARGIHVDGIDLVIHADSPTEHKAYLHRSGRTARAGAAGVVVTLQTPAQAGDVRALMRRAHVDPLTATVGVRSALLRSIVFLISFMKSFGPFCQNSIQLYTRLAR